LARRHIAIMMGPPNSYVSSIHVALRVSEQNAGLLVIYAMSLFRRTGDRKIFMAVPKFGSSALH
jgi:hypothetical protein